MIVAVIPMRMVESAFDQVIDVIAVRHLFMTAIFMLAAAGNRGTHRWVGRAYTDGVFIVVAVVRVMQMAIVQKIDVPFMLHACMTTMFIMDVLVAIVCLTVHSTPSLRNRT